MAETLVLFGLDSYGLDTSPNAPSHHFDRMVLTHDRAALWPTSDSLSNQSKYYIGDKQ